MSPKTTATANRIELIASPSGLATHYQWEEETLIDYVAARLNYLHEVITDEAEELEKISPGELRHYRELTQIGRALHRHAGAGFDAKIEFKGAFGDIRDFVSWDKRELANFLVYQVYVFELSHLFENGGNKNSEPMAEEIEEICTAILFHRDRDAFDAADEKREFVSRRRIEAQLRATKASVDATAAAVKASVSRFDSGGSNETDQKKATRRTSNGAH